MFDPSQANHLFIWSESDSLIFNLMDKETQYKVIKIQELEPRPQTEPVQVTQERILKRKTYKRRWDISDVIYYMDTGLG